jgi:hypothetical protein
MPAPAETSLPAIAIFPDLKVIIRTPAGREYHGEALKHPAQHVGGEQWYQIVKLNPVGKENQHDNALLRQQFDRAAGHGIP